MPQFIDVFNDKTFNPAVWAGYQNSLPSLFRDELLNSEAITERPELATLFQEQVGGNYVVIPMVGDLPEDTPNNYDGYTNIESGELNTYASGRIVLGRSYSWQEKDFSKELTQEDFMEKIAAKTTKYWDKVHFNDILYTLNGIFNMSDGSQNRQFASYHTYDISVYNGADGNFGATTMNNALQQAVGDNSSIFKLSVMHSQIATNLENLHILEYAKYTDPQGFTRNVALGTVNGKRILITDRVPYKTVGVKAPVTAVNAVYELEITANAIKGDKLTFQGNTYVCGENKNWKVGTDVTADATALVKLLEKDFPEYTFTNAAGVITITQVKAKEETVPTLTIENATSGTLAATISETTKGVTGVTGSQGYIEYTTYVLGTGAIEHTACPVAKPAEPYRNPFLNGGTNYLVERNRNIYAPFGISFENRGVISPMKDDLENGKNWSLAFLQGKGGTAFINHRHIPIARIISRG